MMPILEVGKTQKRIHGFTLLELLIVLVIVGILSSGIALSLGESEQNILHDEAVMLIRTFEMLDEESELRFAPLIWVGQTQGWKVFEKHDNAWHIASAIPPRVWPKNIQVHLQQAQHANQWADALKHDPAINATATQLVFTRRLRDQRFTLILHLGHAHQIITRSAEGRYALSE